MKSTKKLLYLKKNFIQLHIRIVIRRRRNNNPAMNGGVVVWVG